MTAITTLVVGATTTCQLGNPEDGSGYQPSAEVCIHAVKTDWLGYPQYLVEYDAGAYGLALNAPQYVKDAVLYCTNGRRNVTLEAAKRIFEF